MLNDEQKLNAISFFRDWSEEDLIEEIEFFEAEIARPKPYNPEKDRRRLEHTYYALQQRGFFDD